MVPDKNDPMWVNFITSGKEYAFNSLATKMMYTNIKLLVKQKGESAHSEAIDIAHEYFVKNIAFAETDLKLIKG